MDSAQIDELEQLAKNSGWFNIKCVRDVIAFARETLADNARLRSVNATLLAQQTRTIQEDLPAMQQAKDAAYAERDHLVAALSKMFPAWLGYHGSDPDWEDDWLNIVYVELPTGQVSWHIRDSERPWFAHLRLGGAGSVWDGHDTAEKYRRVDALVPALQEDLPALQARAERAEAAVCAVEALVELVDDADTDGVLDGAFYQRLRAKLAAARLRGQPAREALPSKDAIMLCIEREVVPVYDSVEGAVFLMGDSIGEAADAVMALLRPGPLASKEQLS